MRCLPVSTVASTRLSLICSNPCRRTAVTASVIRRRRSHPDKGTIRQHGGTAQLGGSGQQRLHSDRGTARKLAVESCQRQVACLGESRQIVVRPQLVALVVARRDHPLELTLAVIALIASLLAQRCWPQRVL